MNTAHFSHDLTISLIVKNEIATLEDCLKALTPLREQLSCQLIVTDTGSTDGTVEIAKQYADLFLEFDWCNDFAKARNHAIPHATGRWFFYLDADEICDQSLLEVATFLQSPQSHTLGSASVTVRNYSGEEKNLSRYSDAVLARLVHFGRGKRYFQGSIHESIPVHRDSPILPVLLHHMGYLSQKRQEKEGRNRTLLLEIIEKEPLKLQYYIPMIRECATSSQKAHWLKKAFAVVAESLEGTDHFSYPTLLLEQAGFGLEENSLPLLEETKALLESTPTLTNTLPHLELLGLTLALSLKQSRPLEEVLPLFVSYRSLFLTLQETPDLAYPLVFAYRYHTPLSYHTLELALVESLKGSSLLEGGRSLLIPSQGYQLKNPSGFYPLLPKTTYLSLDLDLYPKIDEILAFLKEQGATKDFLDVTTRLATHLKQKGLPL